MSTSAPHCRLFLALWPGQRLRTALARHRDAWSWPPAARRVRTDKLHLTLHFIGAWPQARVDALADALAVPCRPFTLTLGRAVLWSGGLAVLEPCAADSALGELHASLAAALEAAGAAVEARPFRPHLTLARRCAGARPPAQEPALRWSVSGYVLVASAADGSYQILRRYPCALRGD